MYLEKVRIKNFKAIKEIQLEFQPGVNLLIGDNGVGKTSILEAISVGMGGFLSGIKNVNTKNILQEDIRFDIRKKGSASSAVEYKVPVEIECELQTDDRLYKWIRRREFEDPKTKIDNREICKYAQKLTNDSEKILPLLSFQSEARVWQKKRGDFGTVLKKKLNDRRCGYIGCLDYSLDIKGIKEWCLKMELSAFQMEEKVAEYEAFKMLVADVMQKMSGLAKRPEVFYSKQLDDIVYREEGQDMPVSFLSAGYQSLLWMTMDLSYRLALLNPDAGDDIKKIPGIVLIDELDMHLHPKWQWNVLMALEETFPNVQFIVATHSPIIISSCKEEKLIQILETGEVSYLPSAYAYSVEDVLRFRQGSCEKPKNIETLIDKFEKAMNRYDYTEARTVIKALEVELGKDHSEVKKAQNELDISEWVGEN